jgi:hypothetical protein
VLVSFDVIEFDIGKIAYMANRSDLRFTITVYRIANSFVSSLTITI